jgi:hypothetical protein
VDNRCSSAPICFLMESACVSCCRDRSMAPVDSFPYRNCKRKYCNKLSQHISSY